MFIILPILSFFVIGIYSLITNNINQELMKKVFIYNFVIGLILDFILPNRTNVNDEDLN